MLYNLFDEVSKKLELDKTTMPPVPQAITGFLGKLSLFEGVPLHNLVADEKYLPLTVNDGKEKGSLKLFWVDPEWVECLLSGALSLADENDRTVLEKAMDGKYTAEVFYQEAKNKVIGQMRGSSTDKKFEEELKDRLLKNYKIIYEKPEPTAAQSAWRYTGFFIRSSIVSSWAGLEVIAYGESDQKKGEEEKLQIIRLERAAFDTIYCICEGVISRIEIVQPLETTHFKIDRTKAVPMRNAGTNVLDIAAIVSLQNKYLKGNITNSAMLAEKLLSFPFKTTLTIKRKQ